MDKREALLGAVDGAVRELEGLCGTIERALMQCRWDDFEQAMSDSRRVTHAIENAMHDAAQVRDAAFDERIQRRLRHVHVIRENQMLRLQQYHQAVGERLHLVTRWKSAIKSIAARLPEPVRISALNDLR